MAATAPQLIPNGSEKWNYCRKVKLGDVLHVCNRVIFLVQFGILKHLKCFSKTKQFCSSFKKITRVYYYLIIATKSLKNGRLTAWVQSKNSKLQSKSGDNVHTRWYLGHTTFSVVTIILTAKGSPRNFWEKNFAVFTIVNRQSFPMKVFAVWKAINRWFSRYVIVAMLVDQNKRSRYLFCSSTNHCGTLQHCYLCF